jgi:hypothetical protein
MAGSQDDPTLRQSSPDELRKQAEAAFGGGDSTSGPSGVPGSGDGRRKLKRFVLLFILFDVVVFAAAGVYLLVTSVDDDEPARPATTIPSLPGVPSVPGVPTTPGLPTQPREPEPEPPAPSGGFFTTAGLRSGLATARRLAGPGARVELTRITDEQINVIARQGGQRKIVLVSEGFTRSISSPGGGGTGREYSFAAVNPAVAASLDRRIGPPIDYMLVMRDPIEGGVEWLVYPRGGGGHWEADARGRGLRRIG